MEDYLYQSFNTLEQFDFLKGEVPQFVVENLGSKYVLRPYQYAAFKRFDYFLNNTFLNKHSKPYHLLYNMATGSGKTLIMAGLMLYLYEKGYRNFLFFVGSNTIIRKTKDNFTNPLSDKYLFADKVVINHKRVNVREINSFEEGDEDSINIKFVSIQKLTVDLWSEENVRENGLDFTYFEDKRIVLIGDEAHHYGAGVWGPLIEKIHKMHDDNILLEFTATLDYSTPSVVDKYKNRIIYRYDLKTFRKDKYSKEITLIRSEYDLKNRILQAIILNLYRSELAATYNLNLKPVILFKGKFVNENRQHKDNFHAIIENLTSAEIDYIRNTSTLPIVAKAFDFFDNRKETSVVLVRLLQQAFRVENCLSANDNEIEKNQMLLNSLEEGKNPIRAVFAVQKLNEGWDVLNLFDIVRLYETRDTGQRQIGTYTMAEAQLIGRGARYWPFRVNNKQELYLRKYDDEKDNELKILEELYYHTKEDSRYISELHHALVEIGVVEDENRILDLPLKLKEEFKKTNFYQFGKVFYNKKEKTNRTNIYALKDYQIAQKSYKYAMSSGYARATNAIEYNDIESSSAVISSIEVAVRDIPCNIVEFALSRIPFYHFNQLNKLFPNLHSWEEFRTSEDYIGEYKIIFSSNKRSLRNITNRDYLAAITGLLEDLKTEIESNATEYEGSEFTYKSFKDTFGDKVLYMSKDDPRAKGQDMKDFAWFVYETLYGTSEEKEFINMFARRYEQFSQGYQDVYLVRNEQQLKIVDPRGRVFEPDYVLFCSRKTGEKIVYQVFIEPKGEHLIVHDMWKQELLKDIVDKNLLFEWDTKQYHVTGIPLFYNHDQEQDFIKQFDDILK